MIDVSPRFTLSLRGYDKDEVDEYLESLNARSTDTDEQLYEIQERTRELETERQRLLSRVTELEDAICAETPHTVRALGERITLILNEAEAGAGDALTQARVQADYLLSEAQEEADTLRRQAAMFAAQANETLAGAQRQAEDLAERLEAEARARAASIVSDAEGRARRRQEQIEGWAQEVIARTHADQARLSEEWAVTRRRHEADLAELVARRDEAVATLRALQGALSQAVDRMPGVGATVRPAIEQPPLDKAAVACTTGEEAILGPRPEHGTGPHTTVVVAHGSTVFDGERAFDGERPFDGAADSAAGDSDSDADSDRAAGDAIDVTAAERELPAAG
jgi:DivIVA domain-containing protein